MAAVPPSMALAPSPSGPDSPSSGLQVGTAAPASAAQLSDPTKAQPHADGQVGSSPIAMETERQSVMEKRAEAEAQAEAQGPNAATAQTGSPAQHPTPTGKPQLFLLHLHTITGL